MIGPTSIEYATSSSSISSFSPVTVIVCGVNQSSGVNVSWLTETVPSSVLLEATSIVTSSLGMPLSTTVNSAVAPDSVVTNPEVSVTVTPGGPETRTWASAAVGKASRLPALSKATLEKA